MLLAQIRVSYTQNSVLGEVKSVLRIRIRDPNYSIPDPGSRKDSGSATKNFSIFNPKLGKMIWDVHPGIPDPDFLIRQDCREWFLAGLMLAQIRVSYTVGTRKCQSCEHTVLLQSRIQARARLNIIASSSAVLRIWDVYPGSELFHPGSRIKKKFRIRTKEF
jgi:hypothetical protein